MEPQSPQAKTFTLYGLKRPDDNIIRYIGITCQRLNDRLSRHIRDASKKRYHKDFWVSKMFPLRPEIIPFAVGLTQEEVLDLERFVIAEARKQGRDLVNQTAGGEGGPGLSGENHPCFGKRQSQETCEKRSEALMGHIVFQETRDKISKAHTGMKHSSETLEKFRGNKNSSGVIRSPESMSKMWDTRRELYGPSGRKKKA